VDDIEPGWYLWYYKTPIQCDKWSETLRYEFHIPPGSISNDIVLDGP
jgi:hypothetical protein